MKLLGAAIMVTTAALASGCSSKNSQKQAPAGEFTVATGIAPVAELIEAIGGDSVRVVTLLDSSSDPEQADLSTAAMKALEGSSIFFSLDMFPMEEQLANNLPDGVKLQKVTDAIIPIWGTHGTEADPHMWMSLRNMKVISATVADALSRARPSAEPYFRERQKEMLAYLDSLDNSWGTRLAPLRGKAFLVGHPALSYFARDYRVKQIAFGAEGHKEQTPRGAQKRIDEAIKSDAKIFFARKGNEMNMAQEMASDLGATVVEYDALAPGSINQMQIVVDKLTEFYGEQK